LKAAGSQESKNGNKKKRTDKVFSSRTFPLPRVRWRDEEKIKFISKVFVSIYRRGENGRKKI
jgi:hypothetical protein